PQPCSPSGASPSPLPARRCRRRRQPHLSTCSWLLRALGLLPSPLWGGAGGGGRGYDATLVRHRTTPTRLASLATLPTRGRVEPSSPLALIPLHLNTHLA